MALRYIKVPPHSIFSYIFCKLLRRTGFCFFSKCVCVGWASKKISKRGPAWGAPEESEGQSEAHAAGTVDEICAYDWNRVPENPMVLNFPIKMIICRSIYKTDTFFDVILFILFTTIEEFKCRAAWKVQYRMQPRLCCQLGCGTTCQSHKWTLFVLRNNYNVKTIITSIFVIMPEKTDPDFVCHLPHESDYLPIYNTSCFCDSWVSRVGRGYLLSWMRLCEIMCRFAVWCI